jgi:hypothetical protein
MPGPFTRIYTARRVADLLAANVSPNFVRPRDGAPPEDQSLDQQLLADMRPAACGQAMNAWPPPCLEPRAVATTVVVLGG